MSEQSIDVTCIDGTWGWKGLVWPADEWTHPKHPCQLNLRANGLSVLADDDGRGFAWSTDLEGFLIFRRLFRPRAGLPAWEVGAATLLNWHRPLSVRPEFRTPGSKTHDIAHSHGGNLPIIACGALGLKINVLVTVSTPIRMDVLRKYGPAARRNIGFHLHYYSDGDETQAAGAWADGFAGVRREHPLADLNYRLPRGAGHTGLLNDPKFFPAFATAIDIIKMNDGREDYLAGNEARWPDHRIAAVLSS